MLVHYNIEYIDEKTNKTLKDEGLASGYTLGKAVDNVARLYGENNVLSIEVYECENVLTKSDLKDII